MIIVTLQGGLGNQMFQYAFGRSTSLKHNVPLLVDTSFLEKNNSDTHSFTTRAYQLDAFDTKIEIASPELIRSFTQPSFVSRLLKKAGVNRRKVFFETSVPVSDQVGTIRPPAVLKGYWQSELYFKEHEKSIREGFKFRIGPGIIDEGVLNKIKGTESVAVHVRRGDYVTNSVASSVLGSLDMAYYRDAMSYINSRVPGVCYFLFSDDTQWLRDNFNGIDNVVVVEGKPDQPDYVDLYYMTKCRHNITANSSFSWWGAWLNDNGKKIVVSPKRWFRDLSMKSENLIPENWIQL